MPKGVMLDPRQRKRPEKHSGPPCPHYPQRYKTEAAHQGKVASRRRNHDRMMKSSLDYRLKGILRTIQQRCESPTHIGYRWYGAKGIRNFLTLDDLKTLWERDGAARMKKPSIDREDADGDYEFSNCVFRELRANQKRGWKNKEARTAAIRAGMQAAQLHRERHDESIEQETA